MDNWLRMPMIMSLRTMNVEINFSRDMKRDIKSSKRERRSSYPNFYFAWTKK
jgi:hypothetical protein